VQQKAPAINGAMGLRSGGGVAAVAPMVARTPERAYHQRR
jgi:hypothetical protein